MIQQVTKKSYFPEIDELVLCGDYFFIKELIGNRPVKPIEVYQTYHIKKAPLDSSYYYIPDNSLITIIDFDNTSDSERKFDFKCVIEYDGQEHIYYGQAYNWIINLYEDEIPF